MTPSSRPAYSLIFAFVVMTILLVVTGASIQNTTDKVALYNDMEGSSQAYLSAQSSAELGVNAIQDADSDGTNDYSPGYETSDSEVFCLDEDGDGSCNSWSDFIVLAEQKEYNNLYYTPIFGTGTAGNSEDCSVLDYIDLDTGDTDTSVTIDLDDPCHWNKLLYGGSVSIPLFDTDDSSGGILPPAVLTSFSGWNLKLRTPCSDGTLDTTCERYEFDDGTDGTGSDYAEDDSIILWQILGADKDGNEYILLPDDYPLEVLCGRSSCSPPEYVRPEGDNSEIYESLINEASDFSVLEVSSSSDPSSLLYEIYNYCIGDTDNDSATDPIVFTSLILQMDIVSPLVDVDGNSIPYLEWQLEVDSLAPMADAKSVIVGEGYFEGLRNTFYYPYVLTRGTTGESSNVYTLSN